MLGVAKERVAVPPGNTVPPVAAAYQSTVVPAPTVAVNVIVPGPQRANGPAPAPGAGGIGSTFATTRYPCTRYTIRRCISCLRIKRCCSRNAGSCKTCYPISSTKNSSAGCCCVPVDRFTRACSCSDCKRYQVRIVKTGRHLQPPPPGSGRSSRQQLACLQIRRL